ncbi:MAG: hypothetical protein U9R15_05810 [Chloroflexota bacterium]|nr:hypothetical protein [Chloroflexota bacterium]
MSAEKHWQEDRSLRVGLVACSKTKLGHAAPARDLYQGTLFRLASAYAERLCDEWYVLSAKHGLVHPDTILKPYDAALSGLDHDARVEWGANVLLDLRGLGHLDSRHPASWLILTGKWYRKFIVPGLMGDSICIPLAGMGIGKQIAWLKDTLQKLDRPHCRMCEVGIPTGDPGGLCSGCQAYVTAMREAALCTE